MTLTTAIPLFLNRHLATDAESALTRKAYTIDLQQFQTFVGLDATVSDVGPQVLEDWVAFLRQRYSVATVRRKVATVRVLFNFLARRDIVAVSPFWKFRLVLRKEVALPRSLCPADARVLIEHAWSTTARQMNSFRSVRNLALIEILFTTGIRVGELVKLNTSDWLASECIFRIQGKGFRERLALLPDQRSLDAFQAYFKERRNVACGSDALFIGRAGCRLSEQGVSLVLVRIAREAGIAPRVTPHMLRHTLATLLLRYGADIRIVQEVLGHSSLTTTQRYVHVAKDHLLATLRLRHPNVHLGIEVKSRRVSSMEDANDH